MKRTVWGLASAAAMACAAMAGCSGTGPVGVGAGAGGAPTCAANGQCPNGQAITLCLTKDASGACSTAYYAVGSQTFDCNSCTDTLLCAMNAGQACEVSTSSSGSGGSGGGSSGSSSGVSGGSSGGSGSSGSGGSSSGSSSSGSGGSSGSSGSSGGMPTYDGTTGKQCATDADCNGGAGINKCTNTNSGMGFFTTGQLYPTPVCIIPPTEAGNCNPGTDGNLHFCDGPDTASSPGVCLAETAGGTVGICLPQCGFKPDGAAATGCVGFDACQLAGFEQDPSNANAVIGIGYCFGGCAQTSDCPSGQQCQVESGVCQTALTTDPAVGTACNDTASPATCSNCIGNQSTDLGYCAQFCTVGRTACAAGSTCNAQLPTTLTDSADASIAGWTTANAGLAGFCAPTCTTPGASAACYPNSTCQAGDVGGPYCSP